MLTEMSFLKVSRECEKKLVEKFKSQKQVNGMKNQNGLERVDALNQSAK